MKAFSVSPYRHRLQPRQAKLEPLQSPRVQSDSEELDTMSGASPPEPIRKVRRQYQTRPPRSTPLGLHPIRRRSFPLFPTPPPALSPRFRTTGRAFIVRGDRWMKADRVISDCSVGNWSTACHYHSPPRNSSTTTTTTTNEVYLETERQ